MDGEKYKPLVSVIMPVHNAAAYLAQAIDSVLAQTFGDFELLVLNDGSTDNSNEVIQRYSDKRLRVIQNEKNIGLTATLNKAVRLCRGEYIARMDADDICMPQRFEKQVNYLEQHADVSVLACRAQVINADGEITGEWSDDADHLTESEIRGYLPFSNCIVHPSVMMRAEIAKKYEYKAYQKGAEDWDLWLRLLAAGRRIHKLNEPLLHYRVHMQSTMAEQKKNVPVQLRMIRVKSRWLAHQFPKLNAFYFTMIYSLMRSIGSHGKFNLLPHWLRACKRLLTCSPFAVSAQYRLLKKILREHKGRVFLFFPYTHVGGAEQVHADIAEAYKEEKPLVFFTAFSQNAGFVPRFEKSATVLNIPGALNHPFTRKKAFQLIVSHIQKQPAPLVLGSNSGYFYDVAAAVPQSVKLIDLIHAFKYQPEANETQKKYLALSTRFSRRIFVSSAALDEFRTFCFHQNCAKSYLDKLKLIYNQTAIPPFVTRTCQDPLRILFVGRDSSEKRRWMFEKLATRLRKEAPGKFAFTVAGSTGAADGINYLGEISDAHQMTSLYDSADVLVLTSSREGFPMTIIEAMAHGVIPVATPVGDIPRHISAERGFVTSTVEETGAIGEMAAILLRWSAQKQVLPQMANAAHAYAQINFARDRFVNEYRALLIT